MPFKSEAQRKFLYARKPEVAKRWAKKYGTPKNLPEHKDTPMQRRGRLALGSIRKKR